MTLEVSSEGKMHHDKKNLTKLIRFLKKYPRILDCLVKVTYLSSKEIYLSYHSAVGIMFGRTQTAFSLR